MNNWFSPLSLESLYAIVFSIVFFLALLIFAIVFLLTRKERDSQIISEGIDQEFFFREIAEALFECSSKKIGLLIVFAKARSIKSLIVRRGVVINARVNADLIINIFGYKKTNLHDGALIVDNESKKIEESSVLLKLQNATSGRVQTGLTKTGTRHMAAFQIMKAANLNAITISEENGKISFYDGKREKVNTISRDNRSHLLFLTRLKKLFSLD